MFDSSFLWGFDIAYSSLYSQCVLTLGGGGGMRGVEGEADLGLAQVVFVQDVQRVVGPGGGAVEPA